MVTQFVDKLLKAQVNLQQPRTIMTIIRNTIPITRIDNLISGMWKKLPQYLALAAYNLYTLQKWRTASNTENNSRSRKDDSTKYDAI